MSSTAYTDLYNEREGLLRAVSCSTHHLASEAARFFGEKLDAWKARADSAKRRGEPVRASIREAVSDETAAAIRKAAGAMSQLRLDDPSLPTVIHNRMCRHPERYGIEECGAPCNDTIRSELRRMEAERFSTASPRYPYGSVYPSTSPST